MGVHDVDAALADQAPQPRPDRRVERVPLADLDVVDAEAGGPLVDAEHVRRAVAEVADGDLRRARDRSCAAPSRMVFSGPPPVPRTLRSSSTRTGRVAMVRPTAGAVAAAGEQGKRAGHVEDNCDREGLRGAETRGAEAPADGSPSPANHHHGPHRGRQQRHDDAGKGNSGVSCEQADEPGGERDQGGDRDHRAAKMPEGSWTAERHQQVVAAAPEFAEEQGFQRARVAKVDAAQGGSATIR